MLLESIAERGLLPPDPDSGALDALPAAARRTVVGEVTASVASALANAQDAAGFLERIPRAAHLRWHLEVIGQAFALGLEDISVMTQAVDIYTAWLDDPARRPAEAVDEYGLAGLQETILRHESRLFAPRRADTRAQTTGLAQRHVELCRHVLQSWTSAAPSLDASTLGVARRLIAGIADSLLGLPALPYCYLAEELPDDLLFALFALFLQPTSSPPEQDCRDDSIWRWMQAAYRRWCHRPQAIAHWQAAASALTGRLMRSLYGQGADRVVITMAGQGSRGRRELEIDCSDRFAALAWHYCVVGLLPEPAVLSPGNFARAVAGIDRLVLAFHSVTARPDPLAPVSDMCCPDGNTLLRLFGRWLFAAAERWPPSDPGSASDPESEASHPPLDADSAGRLEEGRALAVGILCRIFTRPQLRTPFLPVYLERFYAVLHATCTRADSLFPLVMAVMNSEELLSADLPGVRVLIGSLVHGIRRIVPAPEAHQQRLLGRLQSSPADLRRSCYKILAAVLALSNHFAKAAPSELIPDFPAIAGHPEPIAGAHMETVRRGYGEAAAPAPLRSAKVACLEALVGCLQTGPGQEKNPANLRYLLGVLNGIVFDESRMNPEIVPLVVRLVGEELCAPTSLWSLDVSAAALLLLSQLAELQSTVSAVSRERPRRLLMDLCSWGQSLLSQGGPRSTSTTGAHIALLPDLFETVLAWALRGGWLYADSECQEAIVRLLTDAMGATQIPLAAASAGSQRMQATAELSLGRLLHHMAVARLNPNYPYSLSPSAPGGLTASEFAASARAFLLPGGAVACLYEAGPEGQLAAIVRTAQGQLHWTMDGIPSLRGDLDSSTPADPRGASEAAELGRPDRPRVQPVFPDNVFLHAPVHLPDPLDTLLAADRELMERLCGLTDMLREHQAASLAVAADQPCKLVRPYRPERASARGHLAQLFLTQTGLLPVPRQPVQAGPGRQLASVLAAGEAQLETLERTALGRLDRLPDREQLSAAVLFVRSGKMSLNEILNDTAVSLDFAAFLRSLSWPSLDGLARYADQTVEMDLHVPALIDAAQCDPIEQDEHGLGLEGRAARAFQEIMADLVTVLWLEDQEDFMTLPAKLLPAAAMVYLAVHPMTLAASNGLYRIRLLIVSPQPFSEIAFVPPNFGPLLDGMIVSRECLARLVRLTVISAARFLRDAFTATPAPLASRAALLQDLRSGLADPEEARRLSVGHFGQLLFA